MSWAEIDVSGPDLGEGPSVEAMLQEEVLVGEDNLDTVLRFERLMQRDLVACTAAVALILATAALLVFWLVLPNGGVVTPVFRTFGSSACVILCFLAYAAYLARRTISIELDRLHSLDQRLERALKAARDALSSPSDGHKMPG